MNNRSRIAKLAAIAGLLTLTGLLYRQVERTQAMQAAPNSKDLAVGPTRAGLNAQSLAAAGLSSQQATGVVDDVEAYLAEHPSALTNAESAVAQARNEVERLQRLIQSGTYGEGDLTAFATATAQLNTLQAQRQAVVDAIVAAGAADLTNNQKDLLAKIRANAEWEAPIQFKVVERSQAEWVLLRDALAHEKTAAKYEEEMDPDVATLLTTLKSVVAVSTAKSNLDANTAAVTAAWNAAVNGQ